MIVLELLWRLVLVLSVVACVGCTSSEIDDEGIEFSLGDLLEPFDPPSLEELDKTVEWIELQPVDSLELLRREQESEQPLATAEEALALRNNSSENNQKIKSALGRLAGSDETIDWDASITRHIGADVKSTNPIMGSSVSEGEVVGLTSFGILGFDRHFNPFPAADTVKAWYTSKDRMVDKVLLRDDLTWSDGAPITAHDVVFSFQVIMSEAVPVPAQRSGTEEMKWVEAYDDHTLVFFHKKPLAINIWNTGFSILPKHIYEKSIAEDPTLQDSDYHVELEKHPVVGGAYKIAKRVVGSSIVLERREDYYMHKGKQVRDKPYFREVRFRVIVEPSVALLALNAGDLDEKVLTPEEWKTKTNDDDFYKNNTKARAPEWTYFYFGWNNKDPLFTDKRVRRAMGLAFNHDQMIDKLHYGLVEPGKGISNPASPWYPQGDWKPADGMPLPYKQDTPRAEKLLDEAGWIDTDGDGLRDKEVNGRKRQFEFTILVMNRPDRINLCNLLKENLRGLGIKCKVRPLEFTVLQEKTRNHEFQATFGGWGTGAYPDTMDNLWKTDADRNFIEYSNPEVDRLIDEAKAELDHARRRELFGTIHKILYDDQPYTWLYYRSAFYGFNKKLRGYNFSPRGPYSYGPGFSAIFKPLEN